MQDGSLIVHVGASRTYKTLLARQQTRERKRLIVWDPKGKWVEQERCTAVLTVHDLVRKLRATGSGPLRVALVNTQRQCFGPWAEAAFWWTRWGAEQGTTTTGVAEEIANVTSSQKAPDGFHLYLSQGLEFGGDIYVITQSPTESEKTSIRNRTILRVGQCERADDAAYMAKELRIDQAKVDELQQLEFIERNRVTGTIKKFRGKGPRSNPKWNEVPL
jgi:hypothetical protein